MSAPGETLDHTQELSFLEPDEACRSMLLETGVVVVKDVVPEQAVVGADRAIRNRFYASLHRRLLAKSLQKIPNLDSWEWRRQLHVRTSQVDPRHVPFYMRSAEPAISRMNALHDSFFADPRFTELYGEKPPLNNANIARHGSGETSFVRHQDSIGLTGLNYVLQSRHTRWQIHAWEGSRADADYTFETERGDVTVMLERAGERPDFIPTAHGHEPEHWQADGTEIHSGVNISGEVRYRIALASEEIPEGVRQLHFTDEEIEANPFLNFVRPA